MIYKMDDMPKHIKEHLQALGGVQSVENNPMSEDELSRLEEVLGALLPSSLRRLLLTYGAFMFNQPVKLTLPEPDSHIVDIGLGAFYGSEADGQRGLSYNTRIYKNRMPATIIPFASNLFGDQFCLGIRGDEEGRVFFFDREGEPDRALFRAEHGEGAPLPRDFLFSNLYLIASSFDDFLSRLK